MIAPARLAAVTVTFNPDLAVLAQQAEGLSSVAWTVVDNGSSSSTIQGIRAVVASHPHAQLIENTVNLGLAKALNLGVALVRELYGSDGAVMLLDQDSTFASDAPKRLHEALDQLAAETGAACCVGPSLIDPTTNQPHGFHAVRGALWARISATSDKPVAVATLNGSGTLAPIAVFDRVGDLEDDFFIDHIDTEWSFRASSHGVRLYGVPGVAFDHAMGERGRRVWLLGWRVWPERSPQRHYYLMRNTVRLMRRSYVPGVWKFWAAVKIVADISITLAIDPRRMAQWKCILKGLREGVRI